MRKIHICILFLVLLCGCRADRPAEHCAPDLALRPSDDGFVLSASPCNAVYHWKTTFAPTAADEEFIRSHDIGRIYMRFFDVAPCDKEAAEPIATTVFNGSVPDGVEVLPTVFITVEAMRAVRGREVQYADRIVKRILAMASAHGLGPIREVQFDCDWTSTTRSGYFALCRSARDSLHARGIGLSSTIRLHQLREACPPVDRGALMIYNTGRLKDAGSKNSILDYADAAPYLKNAHYDLPLDFAYPAFGWSVWFRDREFRAILHTTDLSDRKLYYGKNPYTVIKECSLEGHTLRCGDMIRLETSRYAEIMRVKHLAEQRLGQKDYSVIIYHLDTLNLSKYTHDEIENIYRRF